MKYLLDTNICSYIIKHRPREMLDKFRTLQINDCAISSITYAELKFWAARNKRLHLKSDNPSTPKVNETVINSFAAHLDIIEFDAHAADVYADIRDAIEAKGIIVGNADLLIAAHALSLNLVLVTNNIKDFQRFPNIQLENWINPS